jgi:PAS domain S-box-containing protein
VTAVERSKGLRGDRPAAAARCALADRNELAAVAVERTPMPMVITDPRVENNPIVLANKAFLDLTGYSGDEVIGRNCRFLQGEGTSSESVDEIRRALSAERNLEIEILNYRKDGSAFWNQLGISPIHDDEGRLIYFFAFQIDVTDFRKIQILESSERRLLKEVDHRARNALAVVNSIVRLSQADDPASYADAIQQRVGVLAEAHTLLAEKGWKELSLHEVMQNQLRRLDADRVTSGGDQVMISPLYVQPMALVVHELADNAIKHGALSIANGRLDVRWTGREDCGFDLRWKETGVPAPNAGPRIGFGGAMIVGVVERQLGGQFERKWIDGGLMITIGIPGEIAKN